MTESRATVDHAQIVGVIGSPELDELRNRGHLISYTMEAGYVDLGEVDACGQPRPVREPQLDWFTFVCSCDQWSRSGYRPEFPLNLNEVVEDHHQEVCG